MDCVATGLKNSSTIFEERLAKDLRDVDIVQLKLEVLLQNVDVLLRATNTYKDCSPKPSIPESFGKRGYKLLTHKTQIFKQTVTHLRFQLKQDTGILVVDRKQAIATLKIPENWRQLHGFLSIKGSFQVWIPYFVLGAKPLYNSLKGLVSELLEWTRDCQATFY